MKDDREKNRKPLFLRFLDRLREAKKNAVPDGLLRILSPKALAELYQRNRNADSSEAERDFSLLLRAWGIREDEIKEHAKSRRMDTLCGLGVGIFGISVTLLQLAGNRPGLSWLSGMASASVGLCGLIFALCSFWRLQVLESRRFVPFLSWCWGKLCFWKGESKGR